MTKTYSIFLKRMLTFAFLNIDGSKKNNSTSFLIYCNMLTVSNHC